MTLLAMLFRAAAPATLAMGFIVAPNGAGLGAAPMAGPLSPTALVATQNGDSLFIACATASQVLRFSTAERKVVARISVPAPASGLALSADERTLYVTCPGPRSKVCAVDVDQGRVAATFAAGHTALAPVLNRAGNTLYVCNRFNDDVSVINLETKQEARRLPALREPVATAVTADGRYLLVANHLHTGRADNAQVAAAVSVVDTATGQLVKDMPLPNGSGVLNDLRASPDGKYAVVTHLLSHFQMPATQVDRGWMNDNALSLIDLGSLQVIATVLLDEIDRGAANPWGTAWSGDGSTLVVAHAGTHEVSVINFQALVAKLANRKAGSDPATDLSYLVGLRQRVKLPETDRGPRAVVVAGRTVYVANYFSDTLSAIDLCAPVRTVESIPLGAAASMSLARQGEAYFHDGSLCFQGWQSCASCHPGDGRVDGLNWDLPNDGLGNPKNVKSLLLAPRTPPAMSLGVRETAQTAVRAGLRHILFAAPSEGVAKAIEAYLESLRPVSSPWLAEGRLSRAARHGEKLFQRAGCASCHPPELFTDLHSYDVGTRGQCDGPNDQFDTPTLVELWRTAPYLHDGSAATVREVVTTRNRRDEHGKTTDLSPADIDDLCAYLLSL